MQSVTVWGLLFLRYFVVLLKNFKYMIDVLIRILLPADGGWVTWGLRSALCAQDGSCVWFSWVFLLLLSLSLPLLLFGCAEWCARVRCVMKYELAYLLRSTFDGNAALSVDVWLLCSQRKLLLLFVSVLLKLLMHSVTKLDKPSFEFAATTLWLGLRIYNFCFSFMSASPPALRAAYLVFPNFTFHF